MAIRWVSTGRVSYQRLGVLVMVCEMAPEQRSTSVNALAASLFAALEERVAIPAEQLDGFARYLDELRLHERYGTEDGTKAKVTLEEVAGMKVRVQDVWLSDPGLRASATGAITKDVQAEPVLLAVDLGLIRPDTCTLLDRGKTLRLAARRARARAGDGASNPFAISAGTGLLALHALLDADYDFVRAAWRTAFEQKLTDEPFTRRQFALILDQACKSLRQERLGKTRGRADEMALARLAELAKSIANAHKAATRGGARPPDKTATLRLEPYVDMGLVERVNRFEYRYQLLPRQRAFFEAVVDNRDTERFLGDALVSQYVAAAGVGSRPAADDEIWGAITAAYAEMRSGLGYVSFVDLSLLAAARLLDGPEPAHFEVADGVRVMQDRQKHAQAAVKFGIKRGGGLSYVKIGRASSDT